MGSKRSSEQDILIVQTAFLGDVLLGIPLFKTLRNKFPSARLTLLCRRGVGRFFVDSKLIDDVVEVDKSSRASWKKARESLRDHYDVVLSPHESFRTALFVRSIRAGTKIGFSRWFNGLIFDERVRRPLELPESLRQLALLTPMDSSYDQLLEEFRAAQTASGGQGPDQTLVPVPPGTDMKVPALMELRNARRMRRAVSPTSGDRVRMSAVVEPFFEASEKIVVLAPGSVWRTKMWTKEGFTQVGQSFAADGAIVVVMGSREEAELCAEISRSIPGSTSLAGRTTLYESAELLALADQLVCNDSGAMHLGAAAGVSIASVFGPTVLEFGYRPWSSKAVVVQKPLACRPCGKHGARECPLGHHNCMKQISAADVLSAIRTQE